MKTKSILISLLVLCSSLTFGQIKLGVTAGANFANESASFSKSSLSDATKEGTYTSFLLGPTLETMIPVVGLGAEISALYSRKGANFNYDLVSTSDGSDLSLEGQKVTDCIDIPLSLKFKIGIPKIAKVYFMAGYYWSFAFNGSVEVDKAVDNATGDRVSTLEKDEKMDFSDSYESSDNGLTFGAGAEIFSKIQVGLYYSLSLKNSTSEQALYDMVDGSYSYNASDFDLKSKSHVTSLRVTYFF